MGDRQQRTIVKAGRKKLGYLSPRPKVFGGKLIAGDLILVLRDTTNFNPHPEKCRFFCGGDAKYMEVRYGDEFATYRLEEAPLVYSDGPPYPDRFQLGVCVSRTPGVEQPDLT